MSKLEPKTLAVMFCCNEHNGSFGGLVSDIEIRDLITLEGPSDLIQPDDSRVMEMVATTEFDCDTITLTLNDAASFGHRGRARWAGNLLWDSFQMTPDAVLRLLNYLKSTGEWGCTEAEGGLFARWREPVDLTTGDLQGALEAS